MISEETQYPSPVYSFLANDECFARSIRMERSTPPCCLCPVTSFELLAIVSTWWSDLKRLLCATFLLSNREWLIWVSVTAIESVCSLHTIWRNRLNFHDNLQEGKEIGSPSIFPHIFRRCWIQRRTKRYNRVKVIRWDRSNYALLTVWTLRWVSKAWCSIFCPGEVAVI